MVLSDIQDHLLDRLDKLEVDSMESARIVGELYSRVFPISNVSGSVGSAITEAEFALNESEIAIHSTYDNLLQTILDIANASSLDISNIQESTEESLSNYSDWLNEAFSILSLSSQGNANITEIEFLNNLTSMKLKSFEKLEEYKKILLTYNDSLAYLIDMFSSDIAKVDFSEIFS